MYHLKVGGKADVLLLSWKLLQETDLWAKLFPRILILVFYQRQSYLLIHLPFFLLINDFYKHLSIELQLNPFELIFDDFYWIHHILHSQLLTTFLLFVSPYFEMFILEVGGGIEMTSIFRILQRETEDESDVAYFFVNLSSQE